MVREDHAQHTKGTKLEKWFKLHNEMLPHDGKIERLYLRTLVDGQFYLYLNANLNHCRSNFP